MNKFLLLFLFLISISCGNKIDKVKTQCDNLFENENIELCLPSKDWKQTKIDKAFIFENKKSDSLSIDKSIIAIMIDNYQSKINAKDLRNQHLERFEKNKNLSTVLISKQKVKINGKTYYDFEINSKNNEVYSYFLFYTKGEIGFVLSATIVGKITNGIDKKDYLNFFSSLQIK